MQFPHKPVWITFERELNGNVTSKVFFLLVHSFLKLKWIYCESIFIFLSRYELSWRMWGKDEKKSACAFLRYAWEKLNEMFCVRERKRKNINFHMILFFSTTSWVYYKLFTDFPFLSISNVCVQSIGRCVRERKIFSFSRCVLDGPLTIFTTFLCERWW
jgi:hypothetical protein